MKRDFSDLTTDLELSKTEYYNQIVRCFQKLDEYHTLSRFSGYCLAASDIVSKMLTSYNIDCKIIECELMITYKESNGYTFVGFDDMLTDREIASGSIDTHAIVITNTEIPMLIDASIAQYLPSDHSYIVERTHRTTTDPTLIAEYEIGDCTLRYFIKKNVKWSGLHNANILSSLNFEKATKTKISFLQKLLISAIGIGVINLLFNFFIITHKLFF